MQNRLTLIVAATLAAGTFAFIGNSYAEDKPAGATAGASADSKAGAHGSVSLPAGVTKSDRADEAGIRSALAKTVESVLQEGKLNEVSQCLASNDRTRVMRLDAAQLNPKIQQLREAFKTKYNQDFDIKEEVVFGDQAKGLEIVQGEISNPALLSNWPVTSGKSSGTSTTPGTTPGSGKAEPGRPGDPGTLNDRSSTPGASGAAAPGAGRAGAGATDATGSREKAEPGRPGDPGTLTDRTSGTSGTAAGTSGTSGIGASGRIGGAGAAGASTLNRGMNVAIVILPANQQAKAPEVTVSLVRESGAGAGGAGARPGAGAGASGSVGVGGAGASGSVGGAGASGTAGASADAPGTGAGGQAGIGAGAGAGVGAGAAGDWKIDIPNNVTSEQLAQNLSKHIDEVLGMKDSWPADANEAYRAISQHVLMAFYDTGGAAAGAGAGARGGAFGTSGSGAAGSTGAGGTSGTGTTADKPDPTR